MLVRPNITSNNAFPQERRQQRQQQQQRRRRMLSPNNSSNQIKARSVVKSTSTDRVHKVWFYWIVTIVGCQPLYRSPRPSRPSIRKAPQRLLHMVTTAATSSRQTLPPSRSSRCQPRQQQRHRRRWSTWSPRPVLRKYWRHSFTRVVVHTHQPPKHHHHRHLPPTRKYLRAFLKTVPRTRIYGVTLWKTLAIASTTTVTTSPRSRRLPQE